MAAGAPPASASSSTSSSSFNPSQTKKFKFDPLSMLLPHEKKMYSASQANSKPPQQAQQPFGASYSIGQAQVAQNHQPYPPPGKLLSNIKAYNITSIDSCILSGQSPYYITQSSQSVIPLSPPSTLASTPPPKWESPWPNTHAISSGPPSYMSNMSATSSRSHSPAISVSRSRIRHHTGATSPHSSRLEDWEIVETLGTGTFGRVLLVRQRPSYRPTSYHPIFPHLYQSLDPHTPSPNATQHADGQLPHFAMKVLRKSEIVKLKQVEHINSERRILEQIRHPFIVELYTTYQDDLNVYMLLSYIPGGELFSHLRRAGRFSADVTRFYLASIVLAIDYLHSHNIIYRDLKPENLLLDRVGYLRIADFGFAKSVEDRTFTLCGTPEYLAPEIVLSHGHGKAVDWWALGILAFEMLAGYPPFFDDHPLGIYEKILRNEVAFPSHIDPYAKDLIRRLLTADRSKRLGNLRGGAEDVMDHAWFAGVDWGTLERKECGAPIVPRVASMGEQPSFNLRHMGSPLTRSALARRRFSKLSEVSAAETERVARYLWSGSKSTGSDLWEHVYRVFVPGLISDRRGDMRRRSGSLSMHAPISVPFLLSNSPLYMYRGTLHTVIQGQDSGYVKDVVDVTLIFSDAKVP